MKVDFADSKRRRLYVVAAAAFTGSCLPEIINAGLAASPGGGDDLSAERPQRCEIWRHPVAKKSIAEALFYFYFF